VKRGRAGRVVETVDRDRLTAATPQAFRADVLRRAMRRAGCHRRGGPVRTARHPGRGRAGLASGFKITTPEDLELAEAILARRTMTTVWAWGSIRIRLR
jgi:2-C-methyl-D-erythritol 4-phosphate cytidylyltransferase